MECEILVVARELLVVGWEIFSCGMWDKVT